MSKKYKDVRCNCGAEFNTPKELAEHYRKKHPDDAAELFNQIGSVGDPFADKAVRHYFTRVCSNDEKLRKQTEELSNLKTKYEVLIAEYNHLKNALTAIDNVLELSKTQIHVQVKQ